MSLLELQQSVLALPEDERHEFVVWVNRLEANYGDVPGEALDHLAAEIWDQDDQTQPYSHHSANSRALVSLKRNATGTAGS